MDITILIRRKADGYLVHTTARSFNLLTNADEWDVVKPEQQYTPPVQGKSVRAEELQAPVIETFESVDAEAKKPRNRRRRS